jgi:hypothetical protein
MEFKMARLVQFPGQRESQRKSVNRNSERLKGQGGMMNNDRHPRPVTRVGAAPGKAGANKEMTS